MINTHVSVNGVRIHWTDYTFVNNSIVFTQAPPASSLIEIQIHNSVMAHMGDGTTVMFDTTRLTKAQEFREMFEKIWKHRNNPTIKDQLEKLQVLVELVDD